jgi:hypothetical protein
MCGKPGWIYDIDNSGRVLNKKLHNTPNDIGKFYLSNVVKEIKKEYDKIINK